MWTPALVSTRCPSFSRWEDQLSKFVESQTLYTYVQSGKSCHEVVAENRNDGLSELRKASHLILGCNHGMIQDLVLSLDIMPELKQVSIASLWSVEAKEEEELPPWLSNSLCHIAYCLFQHFDWLEEFSVPVKLPSSFSRSGCFVSGTETVFVRPS